MLFYKRLCVIFILSAASVFHVASVANTGEGVTSCPDGSQLSIIDSQNELDLAYYFLESGSVSFHVFRHVDSFSMLFLFSLRFESAACCH